MTQNVTFIQEAVATGEEINTIIHALEPTLSNFRADRVCIACLSIVIAAMDPEMPIEKLQEGVKGASEWIVAYISSQNMPVAEMN